MKNVRSLLSQKVLAAAAASSKRRNKNSKISNVKNNKKNIGVTYYNYLYWKLENEKLNELYLNKSNNKSVSFDDYLKKLKEEEEEKAYKSQNDLYWKLEKGMEWGEAINEIRKEKENY